MAATRLFVYGTLRQPCDTAMSRFLSKNAVLIGYGQVQGCLYDIEGYPGLIMTGKPCGLVMGELYEFDDAGTLLQKLDDYEECSEKYPHPTEFIRKRCRIKQGDARFISAWTYLYNQPTAGLTRIVSGDYLEWIRSKARTASINF